MTHDVFISYAYEDKYVADAICAKLESNQIRCWIAPRDIAPGDKYASALINAIDHSAVIVVVFSSNSDKSPHVRTEIERAFNNEKIIIPFRIENIEPCDEMQYFIGSRHWLDALTPPLEGHINNLINVLNKNLDRNNDFKKNENNLKTNITEKKLALKPGKGKYCPIEYRFISYVIDLFFGLLFGFIFYIIFVFLDFSNLRFISIGGKYTVDDFMFYMCLVVSIIVWLILADSPKKIVIAGKNLLNLTISISSEKINVKRYWTIREVIKVFPFLVILSGIIFYFYYTENLGNLYCN